MHPRLAVGVEESGPELHVVPSAECQWPTGLIEDDQVREQVASATHPLAPG